MKKKNLKNLLKQKQDKLNFWMSWLLASEINEGNVFTNHSYIYDVMLNLRIDINLLNDKVENK